VSADPLFFVTAATLPGRPRSERSLPLAAFRRPSRYAIDDSAGDWAAAQAQVAALAAAKEKGDGSRNLSSVVSVKAPVAETTTGDKKRKADGPDKKAGKKGRTTVGGSNGAKKGKK
jgi:hypothetical protein